MIDLGAPHLEFGFYFAELSGDEAIAHVYRGLTTLGSVPSGNVVVKKGVGIRDKPFLGITDVAQLASSTVVSDNEVQRLLSDQNVRVLRITMQSLLGFPPGARSMIVQLPVHQLCLENDHSPVAIWLDGSALSYPAGKAPRKARELGARAIHAFRCLIDTLDPAYAAITVDYDLESPCGLRADPRTNAFFDFYLSESFIGNAGLDAVRLEAPDTYHERTQNGQVTYTSECFSPDNRCLPSEAGYGLSEFTGSLIAARP